MDKFKTLEEAQAEIIRLNERLTEVENERDTFSQNNTALTEDNNRLRKLNQSYFAKLEAQYSGGETETDDDEKEGPSPEEYIKSINI